MGVAVVGLHPEILGVNLPTLAAASTASGAGVSCADVVAAGRVAPTATEVAEAGADVAGGLVGAMLSAGVLRAALSSATPVPTDPVINARLVTAPSDRPDHGIWRFRGDSAYGATIFAESGTAWIFIVTSAVLVLPVMDERATA